MKDRDFDFILAFVSAVLLVLLLLTQAPAETPDDDAIPSAPALHVTHGYSPCCRSPVELAMLEQMKV